jgi:hypothetical protein
MKLSLLVLSSLLAVASAWLPTERNLFIEPSASIPTRILGAPDHHTKRFESSKIRGVNLGSLFIIEPWMTNDTWVSMGCNKTKSESDCVVALGQKAANAAFQKHWDAYITEQDLDDIKAYGLNTIRVPVGFWMLHDLVQNDERFPRGGLKYLDRLAGWAASRNIYVILDLHGAPGAQEAKQPFTGQVCLPQHMMHNIKKTEMLTIFN